MSTRYKKKKISHFREYQFTNGFRDTVDPACTCDLETATLLRYSLHSFIRTKLLNEIYIYINFVCLKMKMSNKNLFKKTFFFNKKLVIFWFVQAILKTVH